MSLIALLHIKAPLDWIYPFIKINNFEICFGLRIDKFSLIMALLLFIISFCVQLFSVSYMKEEKKNYRFFALLNLFNFSMAFLLFSPNLFQFYVFWELVSIVSYLLIGFYYRNAIKSIASKRVFVINRIGDTALLTAILVTSYYMFTYAGNKSFAMLSFEDIYSVSTLLLAYTTTPALITICILFVIGAAVKSAQFPFFTWLQDAMEAEIPVSALLHSATMVTAGIFLLIKIMPILSLNTFVLNFIIVIGALTAIICVILACIETHPKKVLAYSTSANLGFMFTAAGLGLIKPAIILLIAHAFIKSALFLTLPQKDLNQPFINFIIFSAESLSLSGIILAGLCAKEILFDNLKYNYSIAFLFIMFSFFTALYITRLALILYKKYSFKKQFNFIELSSFIILLLGNVIFYILFRHNYRISEPFAASVAGICTAFLLYKHNMTEKYTKTPKITEKINYIIIPNLYKKCVFLLNKIEKNIFCEYKPVLLISESFVKTVRFIEINIMDNAVNKITELIKFISKQDMIIQKGNVQVYNGYAFIIITIIIVFGIIGYTALLF